MAVDIRASWKVLLLWLLLAGVVLAVLAEFRGALASVVAGASAVLASLAWYWRTLRSVHREAVDFGARERSSFEARRDETTKEIVALREELATVDAATRLSLFLAGRGDSSGYERFRGLVGQVYRDLRQLDDDLRAARGEWASSWSSEPPPLERIVLYIDDLDRCPPRRVVEVLAALHLLLALPLFVVVVAVDPRWLVRSLEFHHQDLFSTSDDASGEPLAVEGGTATPLDYLDKIFQIPFALRPMGERAAGYLRRLVGPVAPSEIPTLPAANPPTADFSSHENEQSADRADAIPQRLAAANEDDEHDRTGRGFFDRYAATADRRSRSLPDLQPEGLRLRQCEVDFIPLLGPLLPTPRAAKKLVNIYRLMRIGIPNDQLPEFVGGESSGPYQAVLVLLAITVGTPDLARTLLARIASSSPDEDLIALLKRLSFTPTRRTADDRDTRYGRIAQVLEDIRVQRPLITGLGDYQRWGSHVARFSFYTRDLHDDEAFDGRSVTLVDADDGETAERHAQ